MSTEPRDLTEIRRVVDELDGRPRTVKAIDVELGEDSTGEAAAWIWLVVDPSVEGSKDAIHEVTLFAGRIQASVIDRSFTPWPYVRLRVAANRQ